MQTQAESFEIIVIGAGIAGASVAAALSQTERVLLLERENQPGYHTTGRSAALFTETYGPPVIRALSRASGPFFRDPQSRFLEHPLLRRRGVLLVANKDQLERLEVLQGELGSAVSQLDANETINRMPLLRRSYVSAALLDETASDIDVMALLQHYLKSFQDAGGTLQADACVSSLGHDGSRWQVETTKGTYSAQIVVNAAGAWADELADLAGANPVGLVPMRRTALLVSAPGPPEPDGLPMVVDADEQFYLKPDAGKLLLSPADETPSPPCDAQPEEMDVAVCIDRIETAFDLSVRRIEHKWAGLRSFVADRCPVVGFDPFVPGFFWLAGQGGYGIQSAPALARVAAALACGQPVPPEIADEGVDELQISPRRATSLKTEPLQSDP